MTAAKTKQPRAVALNGDRRLNVTLLDLYEYGKVCTAVGTIEAASAAVVSVLEQLDQAVLLRTPGDPLHAALSSALAASQNLVNAAEHAIGEMQRVALRLDPQPAGTSALQPTQPPAKG